MIKLKIELYYRRSHYEDLNEDIHWFYNLTNITDKFNNLNKIRNIITEL